VRLEPLSARHAPSLYELTHCDEAGAEFWDYLPYGPFAAAETLAAWITDAPSEDFLFYAICDRARGDARGVESLMRTDPLHGVIEIGHVWLSPSIQRSREGTEAIFLLMRHVFDGLGYRRLEWKCDALNRQSRRAAARYGFTYEGVFRQAAVVKQRNRDTAWFSVIDREWPLIRAALETWLDDENFTSTGHQRRGLSAVRADLTNANSMRSQPA
jgi:RimJ/RimL family protein N-acetyltransferase